MAATASFLNPNITRLDLLCGELQIGVATGFFYRCKDQWFLVSNWHVFAGRDPRSGQPKHSSMAIPDGCRYYTPRLVKDKMTWEAQTVRLGDASSGSASWYEHPIHGQDCDVAAIRLETDRVGIAKDLEDEGGCDHDMFIDLGHDLFLPGYPLGIASNGMMPIWKRASLASSLEFGHGIGEFFYVDTATREGMSGSPCIAISNWRHYAMNRATGKMRVVERPMSWRLLGVYSGRRNPSDAFEAQIGIVWHYKLMLEVIGSGRNGSVQLRNC